MQHGLGVYPGGPSIPVKDEAMQVSPSRLVFLKAVVLNLWPLADYKSVLTQQ